MGQTRAGAGGSHALRPDPRPRREGTWTQVTGRGDVPARPRSSTVRAGRRLRRPRRAPGALHLRGGGGGIRRNRVHGADAALYQESIGKLLEPATRGPALDAPRRGAAGAARARRAPGRGRARAAQTAWGRDTAPDQHSGGERGEPQALRRHERVHAHARVVRGSRRAPWSPPWGCRWRGAASW
jgi:hypothetical protein